MVDGPSKRELRPSRARRIAEMAVAPIGFGAMALSVYDNPDEAEALRVIHAALGAGVQLLDTADIYCPDPDDIGHNERLVARALRESAARSDVLVATKGGLERGRDGSFPINAEPRRLERACEASLRSLGVDCIELYQLHAPDPVIPFCDSVGAVARLQEAGKVRRVGLSNVSVRQIIEAESIVGIASVQNCLGPFIRDDFASGVLAHCEERGIAYLAYSPFGGRRGKGRISESGALQRIGARHGVSPFQVTLAWLLACSPALIPLPGARRPEAAVDNARATRLQLDSDDFAELETAFPSVRKQPAV